MADKLASDRTWPIPNRSHAMRMKWHDLLFTHWPIDVCELESTLPAGLNVDTFEGQAWIGVVPFRMSDVAPRFVPAIPGMSAFPELNVRTYVTVNNKPGVWFYSLDATSRIAVRVARAAFNLPYMDARMSLVENANDWIDYRSERTHRNEPAARFVGRYRPVGECFYAKQGTLEHWLTARYCLYVCTKMGALKRGEIDHPPWLLQRAECEIDSNTMLGGFSVDVTDSPHLLFAREVSVRGWTNRGCGEF